MSIPEQRRRAVKGGPQHLLRSKHASWKVPLLCKHFEDNKKKSQETSRLRPPPPMASKRVQRCSFHGSEISRRLWLFLGSARGFPRKFQENRGKFHEHFSGQCEELFRTKIYKRRKPPSTRKATENFESKNSRQILSVFAQPFLLRRSSGAYPWPARNISVPSLPRLNCDCSGASWSRLPYSSEFVRSLHFSCARTFTPGDSLFFLSLILCFAKEKPGIDRGCCFLAEATKASK